MYQSEYCCKSECYKDNCRTGNVPEPSCVEAVKIDPAAVFAAYENYHYSINRTVDQCGDNCGNEHFFADLMNGFCKTEGSEGEKRSGEMHIYGCPAEYHGHKICHRP